MRNDRAQLMSATAQTRVSRSELTRVLGQLAKLSGKSASYAGLVTLRVSSLRLDLISHGMDVRASLAAPTDSPIHDTTGECVVLLEQLREVLKGLSVDQVTVAVEPRRWGPPALSLQGRDLWLADVPAAEPWDALPAPARNDELSAAIWRAFPFASADPVRTTVTCVRVSESLVQATDGYLAYREVLATPHAWAVDVPQSLLAAAGTRKSRALLHLARDGALTRLYCGWLYARFGAAPPAPPLHLLFEQKQHTHDVSLGPQAARWLLDTCDGLDAPRCSVHFAPTNDGAEPTAVRIIAGANHYQSGDNAFPSPDAFVVTGRYKAPDVFYVERQFNPENITRALSAFPSLDNIQVGLSADSRDQVFIFDGSRTVIVMPMRL